MHQITNTDTIKAFIFAGNSTFTIRSTKTGNHFTFKFVRADGEDAERPWFVKLLSGANNESDYRFVGTVFPSNTTVVRQGKKGMSPTAPSVTALAWYLTHVGDERVSFFHEDRCARCGRKLTVPESIATGFGPECASILGIDIVQLVALEKPVDEEKLAADEDLRSNTTDAREHNCHYDPETERYSECDGHYRCLCDHDDHDQECDRRRDDGETPFGRMLDDEFEDS